jgi:hypothetical protein
MYLNKAIRQQATFKIEMILKEIWPGENISIEQDKLLFKVFTLEQDEVFVLCDVLHELAWQREGERGFQVHAHNCPTPVQGPCVTLSAWNMSEMDAVMLGGVGKPQIKELVEKYKSVRDLEKHPIKMLIRKIIGFFH